MSLSRFCSLSFPFLPSTSPSSTHSPLSLTFTITTIQLLKGPLSSSFILHPSFHPCFSLSILYIFLLLILYCPSLADPCTKQYIPFPCIFAFIFLLPLSPFTLHSFFGQNPHSFGCVVQPQKPFFFKTYLVRKNTKGFEDTCSYSFLSFFCFFNPCSIPFFCFFNPGSIPFLCLRNYFLTVLLKHDFPSIPLVIPLDSYSTEHLVQTNPQLNLNSTLRQQQCLPIIMMTQQQHQQRLLQTATTTTTARSTR